MRNILITTLLAFLGGSVYATAPTWTINKQKFAYTATYTGIVNVNGIERADTNDVVAVFVGTECRGTAHLHYEAIANRYLFFLSIYGNQTDDILVFKTYLSKEDKIIDLPQTAMYVPNEIKGSAIRPFSLSNPALGSQASFATISVDGQSSATVTDSLITINVPEEQDLKSIALNFTTSDGATVWIADVQQVSGTTYDFTKPLFYKLLSADYSIEKTIKIQVIGSTPLSNSEFLSTKLFLSQNGSDINIIGAQANCTISLFSLNGTQQCLNTSFSSASLAPGVYYIILTQQNSNTVLSFTKQ